MRRGFLYLVAIIDWHTRMVLSWRISNTLDADFCVEALNEAIYRFGPPDIMNSPSRDYAAHNPAGQWIRVPIHIFRLDRPPAPVGRPHLDGRQGAGWVNLILTGFGVAALMLSVMLLGEALTRFGTTHWQTRGEMKRNGFFAKPGGGFLLGKMGPATSKRPFLVSKTFPHALIVAPTGRGKGVGFVIPNLLTYKGSAVVLDVKGENFRETSRFRASMGDKVFRFAPTDWAAAHDISCGRVRDDPPARPADPALLLRPDCLVASAGAGR